MSKMGVSGNPAVLPTCQAMALSVRHWSASPSGSLTVSFCRLTNRDRIVSSLDINLLSQYPVGTEPSIFYKIV